MKPLRTTLSISPKQRGAAMMIMLVIMVVGIAAFLVSALNSSALKSARDQRTADVLAQAKDALISRAVTDDNRPGSLPCPDTNDDGISEWSGVNCTSDIGRLPWKTLGLPELRDASGEHLWYTLSTNFRDNASSSPLNSERNGLLTVTSGAPLNNVIAIVFAPGSPLTGQDRSSTATTSTCTIGGVSNQPNSFCLQNYLEGSNAAAPPNLNFQSTATGIEFNDQMITITREQLFPPVEMRIAREAKQCLDDYATNNGGRYPWAADPADTFFASKPGTLFGRLPKNIPPDLNVQSLIDSMNAFQTAVTNCAAGTGNQTTLASAGSALENAADYVQDHQSKTPLTSPLIPIGVTTPAKSAGDKAKDATVTCADIQANPTGNSIQTNISAAVDALNSMAPSLPGITSCTLFASNYWPDWSNQIFYQVDPQYRPSGGGASQSITINSIGPYRAVVVIARSPISQVRVPSNPATYLEGGNPHLTTAPSPAFTSNSLSSPNFKTVNDLVVCLDGKVNCK